MYLNTETLTQCTERDIRAAFPNTSFSDQFTAPEGYEWVFPVPQPAHDPITQMVRETTPALTVKGHWEQQWEVVPRFESDAEADAAIATDLAAKRASIWDRIKALRDEKTQRGGYKAAGKWFHSDTFSRSQQIGLVIMGASIPAELQWKTMDGTFVSMTPALAQQVFQAAAAHDSAIFTHAESLRLDVEAATDPNAIDITAGWPETFSGV